jgi:divalent metal cation (Fe/Co/Zn/Cd) transporter
MASSLPTIYSPIDNDPPPRTPSPPSITVRPGDNPDAGDAASSGLPTIVLLNPDPSPRAGLGRRDSATSSFLHPDANTFLRPRAAIMGADDPPAAGADGAGPFNFQTQFMSTSPVKPVREPSLLKNASVSHLRSPANLLRKQSVGQRRGHRYKHSSISAQHQIFQEPPQRPPPVLPASLPIPSLREAWASTHRSQRVRAYWSAVHALVAVTVFLSASGSLALTALSHLVFFDVGSAAICVAVDVLGNFEVWRRSSVRHPFGLRRAEVLAGFAMSVFMVFGGFDLLSHNLKHALEGVGHHEPHHQHQAAMSSLSSSGSAGGGHGHSHGAARVVSPYTVDVAALAAGVSTLVSAYVLGNHARIRRIMRVNAAASLPANPFHVLTLAFSGVLLLLPLLGVPVTVWLDRAICAAIALGMFALGGQLAVAQGLMLLMSWSGRGGEDGSNGMNGTAGVVRDIEAEPHVSRVEEARFWQVHSGLCMATLKVCVVKSCDDTALSQLRSRVSRVIQNRLGEGYGKGTSLRWEVTMQTRTDTY